VGKISIEKATKAILPFYVVMVLDLILVTFIPAMSLFLPKVMM